MLVQRNKPGMPMRASLLAYGSVGIVDNVLFLAYAYVRFCAHLCASVFQFFVCYDGLSNLPALLLSVDMNPC